VRLPGRTYKSRWTRLALLGLMDMSGSLSGRLVVASDTREGDVIADGVLSNVNTVLEKTTGALLARNGYADVVDDLVRRSFDVVLSVEVEDLLVLETLVFSGRSSYSEGSAEESKTRGREMHDDGIIVVSGKRQKVVIDGMEGSCE
jgi:hypothetical protein